MKNYMYVRELLTIMFVLLFFAFPIEAKKVEVTKAENIAQRHLQSKSLLKGAGEVRLKNTVKRPASNKPGMRAAQDSLVSYYVFDAGENSPGFIIIAGDDVARPVLGYSDNTRYDENNLPPNFVYWMEGLSSEIADAVEKNIPQDDITKAEWDNLGESTLRAAGATSVGALLSTKWGQGKPYNNDCPCHGNWAQCLVGHDAAGCVAIAIGQIMKYHRFPTRYSWSSMDNSYPASGITSNTSALSGFIRDCGNSVDMNYGWSASYSTDSKALNALKNTFGYTQNVSSVLRKANYTATNWESLLKVDLANGLPLYYSGSGPDGGHAFVCDGYDSSGKFHFNWGWDGSCDGYFPLNGLNPSAWYDFTGGNSFNDGQTAIINIRPKVAVTSMSLSPSSVNLTINATASLSASFTPSNATETVLTWSSSNTSVATVSNTGVVTAKAVGTATITAAQTTTNGDKKATCTVTVTIPVTGVSLNKTATTIVGINSTETLTATVAPSNATNKAVTWSSSNTSIATVSTAGVVTAKAAGTATITAKTTDGNKTATCAVTVTIPVTGVTLNKSTTTIIGINSTETLTATVAPSNATNKAVTWSSSNTAVATVNSTTGVVTAVAGGTATITAKTTDGNKTTTCAVTVTIPVTGVTLNKTATTLVVGSTEKLTATVAPSNATNKTITWTSDDESIATVNSATGLVTAKAVGTTTINAITTGSVVLPEGQKPPMGGAPKIKASCEITVNPVPPSAMVVQTDIVNTGLMNIGTTLVLSAETTTQGEDSIVGRLNNSGNLVLQALDVHSSSYYHDLENAIKGTDGLLMNTGTVSLNGTDNVRVIKKFGSTGYYFISFPFDVKIAAISNRAGAKFYDGTNLTATDGYWLLLFNATTRAARGMGSSWEYMSSTKTLIAGETYAIWIDKPGEYTFPASSNPANLLAIDKTKSGLTYIHSTLHNAHAGWIPIAPMQLTNYYLTNATGQSNMSFSATGSTKGVVYVPQNRAWVPKYVSGSTIVNDLSVVLSPFTGLMLQISANTNITFKGTGRTWDKPSSNYFRSNEAEDDGSGDTRFDIQLYKEGNENTCDAVAIITTANASADFVTGEDGVKEISNGTAPAVYVILDNTYVALDVVPALNVAEEIPLGIQIKEGQDGNYTFRMSRFDGYANKDVNVYLIDKLTETIELISPDVTYTFTASAGTIDDRFALRIAASSTDIPVTAYAKVFVYAADNGVYVKNLTVGDEVSIYNVTGQLISAQAAAAANEFYPLPAQGVYLVKISGAQSVVAKVINK
ncbi:hypothetical protein FACS1894162_1090 [Bacteroidia bacterium]|nr:hypothetical protein FACS1894162_1090 [Bacteroidia bacterium]